MYKILITGGNGNLATMIKNELSSVYNITAITRNDVDLHDYNQIEHYMKERVFDILIHTAVCGGRRTKIENSDIVYYNLVMFENLMKFKDKFKMIINMDSGAIYDRSTNIYNRSEEDLCTVPTDFYGFSKYIIYQRSLSITHLFHLRIFNIFHSREEPDRFIKSCFIAQKNNTSITIFEDKYFDFVHEDDFITIVEAYLLSLDRMDTLPKVINIGYTKKYKLSDIAHFILRPDQINILNVSSIHYSGDNKILQTMKLPLQGLENSLKKYASRLKLFKM